MVTSGVKRNCVADLEDLGECLITLGDDPVHLDWRTLIQNTHVDRLFLLIAILLVVSFFVNAQSIKYPAFRQLLFLLHLTKYFQFVSLLYVNLIFNILANCILSFYLKLSVFNKFILKISVIIHIKFFQAIIISLIFIKLF